MPSGFHLESISQLEAQLHSSQSLFHNCGNDGTLEASPIVNELRVWFDYFEEILFPLSYKSLYNGSHSPVFFLASYRLLLRYVDAIMVSTPYFLEPYASFRQNIDSFLKRSVVAPREDSASIWRNSVIMLHLLNLFEKTIHSSTDGQYTLFKETSIASIRGILAGLTPLCRLDSRSSTMQGGSKFSLNGDRNSLQKCFQCISFYIFHGRYGCRRRAFILVYRADL